MDEVLDVRDAENVCRLCLSTEEPISSVFADQSSAVSLASKIQASLSIEIQTNDKLSTLVCSNCLKKVNEWHIYKESCLRSQEKLQRCIGEQLECIPQIKMEPMDVDDPLETVDAVPLTSDEEWEDLSELAINSSVTNISTDLPKTIDLRDSGASIKRELLEDEENNENAEIVSINARELLINPMAVGTKDDRIMEADSTEKLFKKGGARGVKKKIRRNCSTHYRGPRKYKQRCPYCQIYLHSKFSFAKHMERFHSGKVIERKSRKKQIVNEENENLEVNNIDEMIEDVEDELISLEKDAPLTPVQQNIISQLKTFSCYTCKQYFQDRRSTLNHIRHHMPDLRPYTCIACLTEFADRSIYKLHCGASFQCAMKIALVIPEHGTEKYFTCNMCLRPLSNRKELLSHLSKHSDKQYEQLVSGPFCSPPKLKPILSSVTSPSKKSTTTTATILETNMKDPFMNGNPAYNNHCSYCGMIYKWKLNLSKHEEMCKKIPSNERICYRCGQCGLTFIDVRRIIGHLSNDHKTRIIDCYHCNEKFQATDEYVKHYRQHRPTRMSGKLKFWDTKLMTKQLKIKPEISCALCPGSNFATRDLLAEHRKVHLKFKIYSCTICRRMFGNSTALESHMTEHELEIESIDANTSIPLVGNDEKFNISLNSDPGGSNMECQSCGKVFANYPNLRRHIRNVHDTIGRYSCFTCAKTFKSEDQWTEHVENEHKHLEPTINCPQCPEVFESNRALIIHRQNIHGANGADHLACYICGKKFVNESSLRIHRGHHFRVNSRLSIGNREKKNQSKKIVNTVSDMSPSKLEPIASSSAIKSPRARKSFPNSTSTKQLENLLHCQVCDDRFADVSSLRKHLWDVHCARNKPEKIFSTVKLQCELCTNILPDEESLASHMAWHQSNPILGNRNKDKSEKSMECDLCGKFYSSSGNLRKHKKRHKDRNIAAMKSQPVTKHNWGGAGFTCNVCRKVFATKSTMVKHKIVAHPQRNTQQTTTNGTAKKSNTNKSQLIKPLRPKLDFDTLVNELPTVESNKKPVTCNLCKRIVPSLRALYKHRQLVHKIQVGKTSVKPELDMMHSMQNDNGNSVCCAVCSKIFTNIGNMRQHFTKVHGPNGDSEFPCSLDGCKLIFKSLAAKQNHEKTHSNIIYACILCPRHLLTHTSMTQHMLTAHKTNYGTGNSKMTLCKKISLDNYTIKGATGRGCPICKIIYPNYKAMKLHYLKVHEK